MVAASVFVQGYSYRVLTLTVACLTAAGVVPDASAPHVDVALARHWPSLVGFTGAPVLVLEGAEAVSSLPADADTITDALRFIVHQTIDRHLRPLLDAVRAGHGRAPWATGCSGATWPPRPPPPSAPWRAASGPFVEPLAHRFFALAPPPLQGLGSFTVVEHDGRRGWYWERTSCCLFDRLPGGIRCADCSLTPSPTGAAEAYRASLESSRPRTGSPRTEH